MDQNTEFRYVRVANTVRKTKTCFPFYDVLPEEYTKYIYMYRIYIEYKHTCALIVGETPLMSLRDVRRRELNYFS